MTEPISLPLSDIATLLTALVAIAGLLLSIYNLVLTRREKKPQLRAKLVNGFLPRGPDLGEVMLLLEVANIGQKQATISNVELTWNKRGMAFIHGISGTAPIPFDLDPGKNATFWVPIREVATSLKHEGASRKATLRSRFRTAIGTEHASRPFRLDIEQWKELAR